MSTDKTEVQKRRELRELKIKAIHQLSTEGLTPTEIGEVLGVSCSNVDYYIKSRHFPRENPQYTRKDTDRKKALVTKPNSQTRVCPVCGTSFPCGRIMGKGSPLRKYCTGACRNESSNQRSRVYRTMGRMIRARRESSKINGNS